MIKKVVTRRDLKDDRARREDLAYWLSRPPEERVAAVDYLRKQRYGSPIKLQRVVRVIERK